MTDPSLPIQDKSLARLYAYWRGKRGARAMPAWREFDPMELGFILGWLNVIEVHRDPLRFRFRVHGSMLVSYTGVEMTGRFLDEHPDPEHREFLERMWSDAVESREPQHGLHERTLKEERQRFESVLLPLSSDDITVDMLLVAARYTGIGSGRSGLHAVATRPAS